MLIPFLVEPLYDAGKSQRDVADSGSSSTGGPGGILEDGGSSQMKKSSKKFKFRLHAKDSKGATVIFMFKALSAEDYNTWIQTIKQATE